MALGRLHKAIQPSAGDGESRIHIAEYRAMAGNDGLRPEPLDHIQRGGHFIERVIAIEFGEHHAKAFFPQGVCRHQRAALRLKQNDRMRVVPRCRMHLPMQVAQQHLGARLQRGIQMEAWALLARRYVAQGMGVPHANKVGVARWNMGLQRGVARLECGVAPAVVAVQMGVEQQVERAALQRRVHQRERLINVGAVAAVDECGAALTLDQDVVAGQPAPLEDGNAGRQIGGHGL